MVKVLFITCFHPHPLRDVALLWRSLGGGGERGDEGGGGPPWWACSRDKWSERPSGLSPDGGGGGGSPGNSCGLLSGYGGGLRGSSGDSRGRRASGGTVLSPGG